MLPFCLTQPKEQPRHLQQLSRFYLLPFLRKKLGDLRTWMHHIQIISNPFCMCCCTDFCSIKSRLWRSPQIKCKEFKSGEQPGHAVGPTHPIKYSVKHTVQEFQNCKKKMWQRTIMHKSYMNLSLQLDISEELWKNVLQKIH